MARPLKALLANFGTTGDVQPFLALAVELRRGGFEVTLGFPARFRARAAELGFEFLALGPDLEETQNAINRSWIRGDSGPEVRCAFGSLKEALPSTLADLLAGCKERDVLVAGPALPVARMAHELTGIPFVSVQVSHFGGTGSRELADLGRWLVNPLRQAWNLAPLDYPLTRDANSPQLALYAVSRHLLPPAANCPAHYRVTGFFFLDEPYTPRDVALAQFLPAGEPPVVVSLGAMAVHYSPEKLYAVVRDALRLAGRRGILQMAGSAVAADDGEVRKIGYAPHSWLFRHACCVVTHGGSGTTAAVLRAGLPVVFVPAGDVFDQRYWAQLGQERGYSPSPIPIRELESEVLAERIDEATRHPEYARRAAALGAKVRAESGVRAAREAIERLLNRVAVAGN